MAMMMFGSRDIYDSRVRRGKGDVDGTGGGVTQGVFLPNDDA